MCIHVELQLSESFVKILRMYLHGYNQNNYTYITVLVHVHLRTVQVIIKCPDVLSVLLGTDSTTVRSTVGTTVHSTVSTYVRYASKKSVSSSYVEVLRVCM